MGAKKSTSYYLEKCKIIHENNYSYELFENNIVFATNKVEIICGKHGIFKQRLACHINGIGCPECKKETLHNKNVSINFIDKAIKKHGNLYDYSKVEYYNSKTKIKIICKIHGEFDQIAFDHTNGSGCKKCRTVKIKKVLSHTLLDFLEKANIVHDNKYDYSKVEYINTRSKVSIICHKHGIFFQSSGSHLQGTGCPSCSGKISKAEQIWLEKIGIPNKKENRQVKITLACGKYYTVDGFDANTNTIYLFHGDYWHGNPKKFKPDDLNVRTKKTFGELYDLTNKMENDLRYAGYTVISKWQTE